MPRQARHDIPGLLQHVIVRGIERRNIFRDNTDRKSFVERFSSLLEETDTDCFTWALISNHFHILLRPNRVKLKQFMRRLLTGYAINFNKRHHRAGHVFQNRYKSIVCEEETYLLELIRYIHLNPLRAKIVSDVESLNRYKWCGHSVLMGKRTLKGQMVDEVLVRFGKEQNTARPIYLQFIIDGVSQGRRAELVGGGLKNSLKGFAPGDSKPELYDDRVLGSGAFINELRQEQDLRDSLISGMMLEELMMRVENYYDLPAGQFKERSRNECVVKARDVFCYAAVRYLTYSGTVAGRLINIGRSAVSHSVRRGSKVIAENQSLLAELFR